MNLTDEQLAMVKMAMTQQRLVYLTATDNKAANELRLDRLRVCDEILALIKAKEE